MEMSISPYQMTRGQREVINSSTKDSTPSWMYIRTPSSTVQSQNGMNFLKKSPVAVHLRWKLQAETPQLICFNLPGHCHVLLLPRTLLLPVISIKLVKCTNYVPFRHNNTLTSQNHKLHLWGRALCNQYTHISCDQYLNFPFSLKHV